MRINLEKSFDEILSRSIAKLKTELNDRIVSLENRVSNLEVSSNRTVTDGLPS